MKHLLKPFLLSYHRVSRRCHLDNRFCRRTVSQLTDRWRSRWHTCGENAYTPAPHSCLHRSCPRSHCPRRTPMLCWCSGLRTEGMVVLKTNFERVQKYPARLWSAVLSPESLQPNLTAGSHICVTPSQFFSSLRSMQSVSPSQRHRKGMHRPSTRHWNSSVWHPPGGRVAVAKRKK